MSGTYGERDVVTAKDGSQGNSAQQAATADLSRDTWEAMSKHPHQRSGQQTGLDNSTGTTTSGTADQRGQEQADDTSRRATGDGQRASRPERSSERGQRAREVVTPLAHANFNGELINLDVQPAQHQVQRGETVRDIARAHLGQAATEQEIRRHMHEIERANGLSGSASSLIPGETITLPGHTSSGGYVTISSAEWQDGIAPERYTTRGGETLEAIARQHLGSSASQADIDRHIQEIWQSNTSQPMPELTDLRNFSVAGNTILRLPSRTVDGQLVEQADHAPSVRRIVWNNGVERIEHQDGQGNPTGVGFVRRPDTAGAYSEHHWGPRTEDNYDLTRTAEGRYLVSAPPGAVPLDRTDANDSRVNAARWDDRAQRSEATTEQFRLYERIQNIHDATSADGTSLISDTMQRELQRDMRQFEQRARENGLSPQEVARTYQQVERLLQQPDASRVRLAGEIMDQAARPTSVNQGNHGTCAVASLESRTYTRHPSEAARLVTDVALTGHYTTRDGTRIEVRPTMLIQNEEIVHEHGDDNRSYASEIFQVTAVNIEYQRHGVRSANGALELIPAQYVRYGQDFARAGRIPPDEGDRTIDLRTNHPLVENDGSGRIINSPSLHDNQITDIGRQIVGTEQGDAVLANVQRSRLGQGYDQSEQIESEQDLRETLTRLRQGGHLPTQIIVHTGNEPFFADSGGGHAGGSGGWHVVTVTDFDERTGGVSIDNQWRADADRLHGGMDVQDLYLSTFRPGSPEVIQALQRRQREHPRDYMTAIDLLRQRHWAEGRDHISDEQYAHECTEILSRLRDDYWNRAISTDQWVQVHVRMVGVLNDLPSSQRFRLLNPLAPDQREIIQRAEQIVENRHRHAQIGGAAGS